MRPATPPATKRSARQATSNSVQQATRNSVQQAMRQAMRNRVPQHMRRFVHREVMAATTSGTPRPGTGSAEELRALCSQKVFLQTGAQAILPEQTCAEAW